MNDLEILVLMFGITVTCYYIGRYRKLLKHRNIVDSLNQEWTAMNSTLKTERDKLILKEYRQRKALEFYADAANWMAGKVSADGGEIARLSLGDIRVAKREAV
jgi:hypothetical protein